MKDKFKKYIKESGFTSWEDDSELITFYNLIIKECLAECYTKSESDIAELAVQQVYERIQKKFGLK